MGDLLTTADVIIFFGSLIVVMAVGLWAALTQTLRPGAPSSPSSRPGPPSPAAIS